MTATYEAFVARVRDVSSARGIEALLDWDQETYMPKRGAAARAEQAAFIAGVAHERATSQELGELIGKLEREGVSDEIAKANVREIRREYDRATRLPTDLVKELARTVSLSKDAWVAARAASNFKQFAPFLEKLLQIKREMADKIGWKTERYDALMDEFEPGAKASEVQAVFEHLKKELVPLVAAIAKAPRQPDPKILTRNCPRAAQAEFNRKIAEMMGFAFDAGRIDTSAHPFCTSMSPLDVRLTTRYDEAYVPMSLFGVMHEAGHGLYEQGFEAGHTGTPMAQAVSLGIHESQSRMWENMVGRSLPFWRHFFPALQAAFPSMADVTVEGWHFAINTVKPSFIRVEADEVTYGLHIMLRFEMERRLIDGKLAVNDVPAAWNESMKSLFGLTPKNDAEGCLQDIHWSMGIYGYFPTYQLGNLYAAQFFEAARRDLGDLDAMFARGELKPLREWLREKIHRHGKRYRASELIKIVSGRELSPQPFLDYVKAKYRPLYGI